MVSTPLQMHRNLLTMRILHLQEILFAAKTGNLDELRKLLAGGADDVNFANPNFVSTIAC